MDNPVVVAVALFLLAFLWAFFVWPYRRYRLVVLRQQLFDLRDELFEFTKNHESLDFDDAAYGITRTTLNGMLRLAHDFSLGSFLSILISMRSMTSDERAVVDRTSSRREEALLRVDEETAKFLRGILFRANERVLVYVLHTSLLFGPLVHGAKSLARAIGSVAVFCESLIRWLAATRLIRTFEAEAEIIGSADPASYGDQQTAKA
jgi:hypothetical protein